MNYQPFNTKDEFTDSVSALFDEYPDTQERIDVVQHMTDDYFVRFGRWPEPHELSRLGTNRMASAPSLPRGISARRR